jgi:diguanylate cyclase (GGDEF)-like protein
VPALLLARTIVLPLEELSKTSRKIRGGDAGLEVSFKASGELGELVDSFNSMSLSLKNSMEELSAVNSQLMVLTITDPLTGRHNRRYIVDRIDSELKLVKRTNRPLSIIMLDLDYFKKYNDKYGHIAGDEALRKLGDLFRESTRESDVVARYGGEEFLIMMPHTDKEGALKAAENLRAAVEEAVFTPGGKKTKITVSLGVAAAPSDGMAFDDLVEAADLAMYAAKKAGRNRVYSFNEQLTRGASPRAPQKSSRKTRDPSSKAPPQKRRKKADPSSQKTSKDRPSKRQNEPK